MKSLTFAYILLYYFAVTSAALYYRHYNDTDYPGKCVIKAVSLILSPGDIVQYPKSCGRLICHNDSFVEAHSCGIIVPPPGCTLGEPILPEAPYPDCCPKEVICNTVETIK